MMPFDYELLGGGGGGEPGGAPFSSQLRVYFDGNQIVPHVQIVKLKWNHIQWDNNDEWDAENNRFVCKEDGIYHLDVCVNFPNYYFGAWVMFIKNDANSLLNVADRPGGSSTYCRASTDVKLVAGDYVDVRVLHMKTGGIDLWGGDFCMFFNVHRVA